VMLVEQVICAALWFHPAVWLIVGHLRRERELACDEAVVAAGVRPETYARLLVALARRCRPARAPVHAIVRASDMQERVATLLSDETLGTRGRHRGVVLAAGIAFAFLTLTRVVAIAAPADGMGWSPPTGSPAQPGESPASFRSGLFGPGR
jgi:beta-lactamase regulating signal transducer with metallopeptidase domain